MIEGNRGLAPCTGNRFAYGACAKRLAPERGFTLIEALVSLFLLGVVGILIGAAFSFSVKSQQEVELQLNAARSAGRVLEILRAVNFDWIEEVEGSWPRFKKIPSRERQILMDIQDRLRMNGMDIRLTVRKLDKRDDSRYLNVTVLSEGLSEDSVNAAQGEILVKLATYVTRRGLNP